MELSELAAVIDSMVYVRPSNKSNLSPIFLSSYISILYCLAFFSSIFFAIQKTESYSRFITVRALSGKYILTGFIMMFISMHISSAEQSAEQILIERSQHVYIAYALIDFVIIRYIKSVHLKESSHYNNIYFIAIFGLWINVFIQALLWLKLAVFNWNFDCNIGAVSIPCEWYNYFYSVVSNLITVVIVSVIYIDYIKMFKAYISRKLVNG
ncbi:hypothetical protein [Pseudoalteromonas sp. MMG024]|uniref:hypothetical protein n=1 Tax=Pseudoalteromonas sp. MMG024 TaxID=2909980 RepID=UPI001F249F04|nr:hypothetical protein [Pseudoalteromonas sp. MMG024]MCF6459101.1 hypothetical protein [Pseudoalteromonas sp. MMG024]